MVPLGDGKWPRTPRLRTRDASGATCLPGWRLVALRFVSPVPQKRVLGVVTWVVDRRQADKRQKVTALATAKAIHGQCISLEDAEAWGS